MQAPSFYSVHLGRTYTSHTWHARYLDGTCRQHGLNPMVPPPPPSSSVQMCSAITGRGSRARCAMRFRPPPTETPVGCREAKASAEAGEKPGLGLSGPYGLRGPAVLCQQAHGTARTGLGVCVCAQFWKCQIRFFFKFENVNRSENAKFGYFPF